MKVQVLIDSTHPAVRDHQVHGRNLLPGLGYVDLLYQIFGEHGHDWSGLALHNLSILHPLAVAPGEEVMLTIEWQAVREDAWQVVIASNGTRHASAEMRRVPPAAFEERIDLELVRQSARTKIGAEEIYEGCRRRGLVHSGLMKAQGALYVTDGALYVDVAAQDDAAGALMFHPALIDGAAVIAGGFLDPSEQRLVVPLFYESFRASALLQRRCLARIEMTSVRRRNDLSYLSIDFFDESGRKVAELKDLACREIRPSTRSARSGQGEAPRASNTGDVHSFLRSLLAERLGMPESRIRADRTFADLGLVSADLLEMVRHIEQWAGATLSPALLFEYTTIGALAEHLEGRGPSPGLRPPSPHSVGRAGDRAGGTLEHDPIAIIGINGRFPGAASVEELWANLEVGADCITEIPEERWDAALTSCRWGGFLDGVDRFDPLFFGISPREAKLMDPQGRLFLETVWNLLESNGHTRATLQAEYRGRVGVYVGSMYQHYTAPDSDLESQSAASLSSYSAIANRVSYFFGLYGPSIAVDTMCSSALTAIHMACKDLRAGECELAIAGGVNLSIHPKKYLGLSQAQLIGSHPDSRSFGDGDGYLPAETVGAVLLKPLSRAIEDGDAILAVIRSSAVNHGGRANGYTVPNPNAQAALIEEVLAKAGVGARTITYVEAAANGSASGDLIEIAALTKAFGKDRPSCAIGSVKSNIGHAEAASGISQLAKVVMQMQRGTLVPTIKGDAAKLKDTPFRLQQELGPWTAEGPRRALINSFGAGGAYASMVVEEYVARPLPEGEGQAGPHGIVFSALTEERLQAVVMQMLAWIEQQEELSLGDLAYTLQARREAMECRLEMVVASREELVQRMVAYLTSGEAPAEPSSLPEARTGRVLPLPTYPFARERYWITEVRRVEHETQSEDVRQLVVAFLSQALDIPADEIQPNRNLQLYGMDSIVAMRLVRAMERRLGIPVTGRALYEHPTVESFSAWLEAQTPAAQPDADLAVELLEQFKLGVLTSEEIEALIDQGAIV